MNPVATHRATNQTIALVYATSQDLDLRGKGGPCTCRLETRHGDRAVCSFLDHGVVYVSIGMERVSFGHAQGSVVVQSDHLLASRDYRKMVFSLTLAQSWVVIVLLLLPSGL